MNIKYITISGADNDVDVNDLIAISKDHPKVEWGILLNSKLMYNLDSPSPRYPSFDWLQKLYEGWEKHKIQLSGHLCGSWVKNFLAGDFQFVEGKTQFIAKMFDRFQINFCGSAILFTEDFCRIFKVHHKKYIFQTNEDDSWVLTKFKDEIGGKSEAFPFFDTSYGSGKLPKSWPKPIPGLLTGYGGGLSPSNINKQLDKLTEIVGSHEIWIDVESKVRNDNDELDLKKVSKFINAVENRI